MFNTAQFNLTAYNRPSTAAITGTAILTGVGSASLKGIAIFYGSSVLTGVGSTQIVFTIPGRATLTGLGEVQADAVRVKYGDAQLSGLGITTLEGTRLEVREIEFMGDFAPGDRVIINMENYTVKINGENALQLTQGDFFELFKGENELIYTDNEANRTVRIRVEWKDRWL